MSLIEKAQHQAGKLKDHIIRQALKPVGWVAYPKFGLRPEFPELNPIATILMLSKCSQYVRKNHTIIESYPLPTEGAAILTANHFQQEDIYKAEYIAHTTAGRIIRTVLKKSLVVRGAYESQAYLDQIGDKKDTTKYSIIKAFIMRGVGGIPILRDNRSSNIAVMRTSYRVLDSGQLLGVFIQSSRDEEGLLRNLETGVAKIASRENHRDLPIYAFAFSENKVVVLEPFTYNQLRNQDYGRDLTEAEFTICIADRIVSVLPQNVQDDWKTRRETEFIRLSTLKN